jgi:ATP adenylyltransferase
VSDQYFFCFDKISYVQGKKPDGCILCYIRENDPDVVNLTVYSDDFFIVSVNLYPYNPGHLILFPQRHITDIREFNSQEEMRLNVLQKEFLNILDKLYKPHGFNIGFNMGNVAGASIDHLHLHVIPRFPGETGIADFIGGKRVLVEDPRETTKKIKEAAEYLKEL